MNPFKGLLFAAAALLGSISTHAADRLWHPYREVCEKLGLNKLYETPQAQRDQLRFLYKAVPDDRNAQALVLTIAAAARAIRITPDAQGLVEIPFSPELFAENPQVLINLPEGQKVSFSAQLLPRLPSERQLDYVHLMGGIPQANALIRKQAGLLSIFVPTVRKLVLRYEHAGGQQVSVGDGAGAQSYQAGPTAEIVIPFDQALFSRNVAVTISDLPRNVDFAD